METSGVCGNEGCDLDRQGPSLQVLENDPGVTCRSVQELRVLLVVCQTLEKSAELGAIARPVLLRLHSQLGLGRGAITVLNRDTGAFVLSEVVGLPADVGPTDYLELVRPQLERAVAREEPVVAPDFDEWARARARDIGWANPLPVESGTGLICVPLKFGGEVVGTFSIERDGYIDRPWEPDLRILGMVASLLGQAARQRQDAAEHLHSLRVEDERLQEEIAQRFRPANMIGTASAMRTVYDHIERVAFSMTTVLVRGESGTGKELVARALHDKSPRSRKPFVKLNCAALPESIIESELFGHEKGAFTGALALRRGRFEAAEGGSIFLDEIGDLSPTTQVKLLRVLQEREYERVGGNMPLRADVRVIAATSRNLETMMEQGTFREDLFYRLSIFPIYVPPLRERRCDILLLADHFIERYAARIGVKPMRISSAAIDLLMSYHWPGNVRELENCIERAVLLAKGQSIKAHHLPPTLQTKTPVERRETSTLGEAVQALEREMIVDALKDTGSNMAEAARRLGITERQMGLRVRKYDIDLKRFRA